MHLDRIEFSDARSGLHAVVLDCVHTGIRRNSGDGLMCFAIRKPGHKRDTLIEVGLVQRIALGDREWVAKPYGGYTERVKDLEDFVRGTDGPSVEVAIPAVSEPVARPLWRRVFGL